MNQKKDVPKTWLVFIHIDETSFIENVGNDFRKTTNNLIEKELARWLGADPKKEDEGRTMAVRPRAWSGT